MKYKSKSMLEQIYNTIKDLEPGDTVKLEPVDFRRYQSPVFPLGSIVTSANRVVRECALSGAVSNAGGSVVYTCLGSSRNE